MPPAAAVRIPIEIGPGSGTAPRLFRLATAIVPFRLSLAEGLPEDPDWLRGPLSLRFRLPGADADVECQGRAREIVMNEGEDGERAALGVLELSGLLPEAAARIERYVEERLQQA